MSFSFRTGPVPGCVLNSYWTASHSPQELSSMICSTSPLSSSSRSTTPSESTAASQSTAPSSPLEATLCPPLFDLHNDSQMEIDLIPEIDSDARPVHVLPNPFESFQVFTRRRSPSPLPLPIPSLPLPARLESPEMTLCPSNVEAAFWSYGPISSDELQEWEGLRYVASQVVRR